jgi:chitin disaccharide deacetylase
MDGARNPSAGSRFVSARLVPVRRLIINADDLGLTRGVNRAIFEGRSRGVITSTTLMANSKAFDDAVSQAASQVSGPGAPTAARMSVGCHIVLLDGAPVLPAAEVQSLIEKDGAPHFRNSLMDFAAAAVLGRIREEEVEREATAQLRKIQSAGVTVSHFDTHKHAHLFPAVLKPLLRAARACGVRALRNPFAPLKPLAFAHLVKRPMLWKRYSQTRLLRGLERHFRELVQEAGMVTTDGSFGVISTGALDMELFRCIIAAIPEGTWEFVCHPGHNDNDLAGVRTRLRESREREYEVLTSPEARDVLKKNNVELISFWDMQGE